MKFLEVEYPKGTFPKQKTDGAYINETLANNLDTYARKIVNDMHFLIIISGNDAVGNGKTTLATHIAAYLTNKINELHGTTNTFTAKNVALNAKKLVKQSFQNPQYSIQLLDEGDDLTTHGMKQAAVELKRYFRKCRQLNQILIMIIPSFFELPRFYALARSHALINVKFHGEFDRGVFDFYGPKQKKKLYIKGKKDWDYDAAKPDFDGGFFSQYTFFPDIKKETLAYKKKKYDDMIEDAEEDHNQLSPLQIERMTMARIFRMVKDGLPEITQKKLAEVFRISARTASKYSSEGYGENLKVEKSESALVRNNTNNTINNGM
jgi:hypothetical protein